MGSIKIWLVVTLLSFFAFKMFKFCQRTLDIQPCAYEEGRDVLQAGTKRDKLTLDSSTNRIKSLLFKVRSLRMSGSCALDLCGVACGRLDLFYETGYGGPWDVAGGVVILKEAGLFFDPSGGDFDIMSQRVAASNPLLKDAFIEALQQSE